MRLLIVQVNRTAENSEAAQFMKTVAELVGKNAALVKQNDTRLTFRLPRGGISDLRCWFYTYIHRLNEVETFHAIVQAEKDGFDAVIINCFGDPMLREVRQAVNIPVLGIAEASMRLAAMMGARFGVVTASEKQIHDYKELMKRYGLKEQAVPPRPTPEPAEEQFEICVDAHRGIEAFKQVGRELIADGAEVLIPGCGLMAPALRLAPGAEREYPNGLTEVDGVPVMDVTGTAVKLAEMLVALKQAGSCWISRKGFFAQAPSEVIELSQGVLKYNGPGFWDIEL